MRSIAAVPAIASKSASSLRRSGTRSSTSAGRLGGEVQGAGTAANLFAVTVAIACPDKFRGTLSAAQAAARMGAGLRRAGFEVHELPLADGGEGTLDALLAGRGGSRRVA